MVQQCRLKAVIILTIIILTAVVICLRQLYTYFLIEAAGIYYQVLTIFTICVPLNAVSCINRSFP